MTAGAADLLPSPSAVRDVYVLVRRGDEVLLLLRSGTGYKDGEWGPPAGKVKPTESYSEGAVRELREETGIEVDPRDLGFCHLIERMPSGGNPWVGVFFEVNVGRTKPVNREPHKHSALEFFRVSALPERTVDYVRQVVEAAERGTLSGRKNPRRSNPSIVERRLHRPIDGSCRHRLKTDPLSPPEI
jgi:8-oxo-dGTP pyrophosphatase MutT (NUDIX family)